MTLLAISDEAWIQIASTICGMIITIAGMIIGYMKLNHKLKEQDNTRQELINSVNTKVDQKVREVEEKIDEVKAIAEQTTGSGQMRIVDPKK